MTQQSELSLDELLDDPIVLLMMARDRLTPVDIRATISTLRRRLEEDAKWQQSVANENRAVGAAGAYEGEARKLAELFRLFADNGYPIPEVTETRPEILSRGEWNAALFAAEHELAERVTAVNNYLTAARRLLSEGLPTTQAGSDPRSILERALVQAHHANATMLVLRELLSRQGGPSTGRARGA